MYIRNLNEPSRGPWLLLTLSSPQRAGDGTGSFGPPALGGITDPRIRLTTEREGPPGRAGSCGAICCAGCRAAPMFVYKPRSACCKNTAPLPGALQWLPARKEGLPRTMDPRGTTEQTQRIGRAASTSPVRPPSRFSLPALTPSPLAKAGVPVWLPL